MDRISTVMDRLFARGSLPPRIVCLQPDGVALLGEEWVWSEAAVGYVPSDRLSRYVLLAGRVRSAWLFEFGPLPVPPLRPVQRELCLV